MSTNEHPDWVTRGKTIKGLMKELLTFEDLDAEVRISLDGGDSTHCISLVGNQDGYCVLFNSENEPDDTNG